MIRAVFKGWYSHTNWNCFREEIIIQINQLAMQRYQLMKTEFIYYGESTNKEDARRYYVSAVDIIKGRVGKKDYKRLVFEHQQLD